MTIRPNITWIGCSLVTHRHVDENSCAVGIREPPRSVNLISSDPPARRDGPGTTSSVMALLPLSIGLDTCGFDNYSTSSHMPHIGG